MSLSPINKSLQIFEFGKNIAVLHMEPANLRLIVSERKTESQNNEQNPLLRYGTPRQSNLKMVFSL